MKNGIYTALVTPFNEHENIDFNALETILSAQINANVSGVVALGTTAETPSLSPKEKKQILSFIIKKVAGKIDVIAGCGTNNTQTTLKEIKWLNTQKLNAILLGLPSYNKPNPAGLKKHIELCAKASIHPIVLYYVPGRTGQKLSFEMLKSFCEIPNIVAIKDASGDLDMFFYLATNTNKKIYSGNDPQFLQTLLLGGSGIISVASNAFPVQINEIAKLFWSGNMASANKKFIELLPTLNSIFIETNPIPIKYLLNQMGICSASVRLPLGELSQESKQTICKIINSKKPT